jgi:DnaJ-class molecular chaperone
VRQAYLTLAKQRHPDMGGDGFHELAEAYKLAADSAKTQPCPICQGSGKAAIRRGFHTTSLPCDDCRGTGRRWWT